MFKGIAINCTLLLAAVCGASGQQAPVPTGNQTILVDGIRYTGGAAIRELVGTGAPTGNCPNFTTRYTQTDATGGPVTWVCSKNSGFVLQSGQGTSLGFTPLDASKNLADLTNFPGARDNLGLGSMAVQNSPSVNITGGTVYNVDLQTNKLIRANAGLTVYNGLQSFGNASFYSGAFINDSLYVKGVNADAAIEMGGAAAKPSYIDFHSSGVDRDYDARIIATGGTSTTNAELRFYGNRIVSDGILNAAAGLQVAGGAPSGHVLCGNGTVYVDCPNTGATLGTMSYQNSDNVSITGGNINTPGTGFFGDFKMCGPGTPNCLRTYWDAPTNRMITDILTYPRPSVGSPSDPYVERYYDGNGSNNGYVIGRSCRATGTGYVDCTWNGTGVFAGVNTNQATVFGPLTVGGQTTLAGASATSMNITGAASVSGVLGVGSGIAVSGNGEINGTFKVNSGTTLQGLSVTGFSDSGNASFNGQLTNSGLTALGALQVNGVATFNNTLNSVNINSNGTVSAASNMVVAGQNVCRQNGTNCPQFGGNFGTMAAQNSDAVSITGGNALFATVGAQGRSSSVPTQGGYLQWNNLGNGEMDLINDKGLGVGGWAFFGETVDTHIRNIAAAISNNGDLSLAGGITAGAASFQGGVTTPSFTTQALTVQGTSTFTGPIVATTTSSTFRTVRVNEYSVGGVLEAAGSYPTTPEQGSYIMWNHSSGQGNMSFVDSRGGGGGGYDWIIEDPSHNQFTAMTLSSTGNLTTTGSLVVNGGATIGTDLNIAGTATLPNVRTNNIVVAGQGVCLSNGTGCPAAAQLGTMAQQNANNVAITGGTGNFAGLSINGVGICQTNGSGCPATATFGTMAQQNANNVSITGGTGVFSWIVANTSTAQIVGQGGAMMWNILAGTGETDFVNNPGAGGGGFAWFNEPPTNHQRAQLMFLGSAGDLTVVRNLTATGGQTSVGNLQSGFTRVTGNGQFDAAVSVAGTLSTGALAVNGQTTMGNLTAGYTHVTGNADFDARVNIMDLRVAGEGVCRSSGGGCPAFSLGYTALDAGKNLADLTNLAGARDNLGLGSLAVQNYDAVTITGGNGNFGSLQVGGVAVCLSNGTNCQAGATGLKSMAYQDASSVAITGGTATLGDVNIGRLNIRSLAELIGGPAGGDYYVCIGAGSPGNGYGNVYKSAKPCR